MDDATKTMMLTLASGAVKKGLIVVGASLATHGWISGNQTQTFVSLGMAALPVIYSFWQDYGKAILLSQLEVLKAKSLAQAAKLKAAGVSPVSVSEIAEQSTKLSPAAVTKTIATLPGVLQENVAK
jgi:hypothetical protein